MRDDPPASLTSPGLAIAERASWETRFHAVILAAARQHLAPTTTALTAGFRLPGWNRVVDAVTTALELPGDFAHALRLATFSSGSPDPQEVADRIAPTLATRAYNRRTLTLLDVHGYSTKQWVTRRDTHVRGTHLAVDGQKKRLSEPFMVGGHPMQHPGDPVSAPPGEWMNCRCVLIGGVSTRRGGSLAAAGRFP